MTRERKPFGSVPVLENTDLALKHYDRESIFAGRNLSVKDTTTSIKATDAFLKLRNFGGLGGGQLRTTNKISGADSGTKSMHKSLIRIAIKPIFFKDWCAKEITKVKHLQKPGSSNFLSLNEFQLKYGLSVSPLIFKFFGIVSAVKILRKEADGHDNSQDRVQTFFH